MLMVAVFLLSTSIQYPVSRNTPITLHGLLLRATHAKPLQPNQITPACTKMSRSDGESSLAPPLPHSALHADDTTALPPHQPNHPVSNPALRSLNNPPPAREVPPTPAVGQAWP